MIEIEVVYAIASVVAFAIVVVVAAAIVEKIIAVIGWFVNRRRLQRKDESGMTLQRMLQRLYPRF